MRLINNCRWVTCFCLQVQKLQENKNLSADLLNAAHQVLITRNNIRQLMKKCTNLAQQMERAVAAGAGMIRQPHILNSELVCLFFVLNNVIVLFFFFLG